MLFCHIWQTSVWKGSGCKIHTMFCAGEFVSRITLCLWVTHLLFWQILQQDIQEAEKDETLFRFLLGKKSILCYDKNNNRGGARHVQEKSTSTQANGRKRWTDYHHRRNPNSCCRCFFADPIHSPGRQSRACRLRCDPFRADLPADPPAGKIISFMLLIKIQITKLHSCKRANLIDKY